MSNSLQDQLIKAGLATRAQAEKAQKQKRAEERAQRRPKKSANQRDADSPTRKPKVADKARQLNQQKAEANKKANKGHQDKYAERALRAEIRQLVKENDVREKSPGDDAVAYNFVHGKRIKRLYVTPSERDKLSNGHLIVINNDGVYHFVTPEVAAKIEKRDPKRIIVAHGKQETDDPATRAKTEDDEYYAKFQVPDDLDW